MAKPDRLLPDDVDIREYLLDLPDRWRRRALDALGPDALESYDRAWSQWAHGGQIAPPEPWSTWVIKGGRGFGKTRAGAEWIAAMIAAQEGVLLQIALVGASLEDARKVMVEGRSGLIEVAADLISDWEPSRGRLSFRSGARAQLFSGASPDMLRGPEHHYAWCDELAKWEKPQETWDMLQLGLRLGANPRAVVTTTPRSGPELKAIMDDPDTVVTGGPTSANPHTPASFKRRVTRLYAGTRLGRQELDGEVIPNAAGALWTVELIERCRLNPPRHGEGDHAEHGGGGGPQTPRQEESPHRQPPAASATSPSRGGFTRTLIAVDPPIVDGTCGIIACARSGDGDAAIAHILADHSVTARSPEGWSSAVAAAAEAHGTTEVVAEANQGGKMVKAIFHTADPRLRVRLVHASTGKTTRAEPVSHLFEAGRAVLHGRFPELEAQLLGMIAGGGYEGPGHSPDRADAMVWGVSELMRARAEARVRGL